MSHNDSVAFWSFSYLLIHSSRRCESRTMNHLALRSIIVQSKLWMVLIVWNQSLESLEKSREKIDTWFYLWQIGWWFFVLFNETKFVITGSSHTYIRNYSNGLQLENELLILADSIRSSSCLCTVYALERKKEGKEEKEEIERDSEKERNPWCERLLEKKKQSHSTRQFLPSHSIRLSGVSCDTSPQDDYVPLARQSFSSPPAL